MPQQLQEQGVLGLYQIDLGDFTSADIPPSTPRVYTNGAWQADHSAPFTTEVISIHRLTESQRQELLSLASTWHDRYQGIDMRYDDYISSPDTRLRALAQVSRAGPLAATHLILALRNRGISTPEVDTLVAVTRHRGRVVSMFLIDSLEEDDEEQTSWTVSYALSEPASTIPLDPDHPTQYAENAVRGAGQSTLLSIVHEAQAMQVTSIRATAISIPSALMFHKTGFKLIVADDDSDKRRRRR